MFVVTQVLVELAYTATTCSPFAVSRTLFSALLAVKPPASGYPFVVPSIVLFYVTNLPPIIPLVPAPVPYNRPSLEIAKRPAGEAVISIIIFPAGIPPTEFTAGEVYPF